MGRKDLQNTSRQRKLLITFLYLGLMVIEYLSIGFLLYLIAVESYEFNHTFESWIELADGFIAISLLSSIAFSVAGVSNAVSIEGGEQAVGKSAFILIGGFWWILKSLCLANELTEILPWHWAGGLAGFCSWTMLILAKELGQLLYTPGKLEHSKLIWKIEAAILAFTSITGSIIGYLTARSFNF